jgi:hypothetical protein
MELMQLAIVIGGLTAGGDLQPSGMVPEPRHSGYIVIPDSSLRTRLARQLAGRPAEDPAPSRQDLDAGYIEVPLNTFGDEEQAAAPEEGYYIEPPIAEETWYDAETGVLYYRQALIGPFPANYELFGITRLKRPEGSPRPFPAPPGPPGDADLVADRFNDAARRAQLHFAEAASPDLSGMGEGHRRAMLHFHRASSSQPVDASPARPARARPARGAGGW